MRHGSELRPKNRFDSVHRTDGEAEAQDHDRNHDHDHVQRGPSGESKPIARIEYLDDQSRSIVSSNDSPDIPFDYSLNPYRGCVHGCAYCYARPSHEYLGFDAGLGFETKIMVKREAAELFEKFLRRRGWDASPITFSGVTDCYQPIERTLLLTRRCLEVAARFGQPISIVSKNALVERDLDLLAPMAAKGLVHFWLSMPTMDKTLSLDLEPRTSRPVARLRAATALAEAGVPVGVVVAPIIPGLNDHEIADVLSAASEAGVTAARYNLLRLPGTVRPVFENWLRTRRPDSADKVLGRIAAVRGGSLNDSRFGHRMRGTGPAAELLRTCFHTFRQQFGLSKDLPPHRRDGFRAPAEDVAESSTAITGDAPRQAAEPEKERADDPQMRLF